MADPWVPTTMIAYTWTTSPHEGSLRAERIGNDLAQFFLYALMRLLVCTTTKKRAPLCRNHEPNHKPNHEGQVDCSCSWARPGDLCFAWDDPGLFFGSVTYTHYWYKLQHLASPPNEWKKKIEDNHLLHGDSLIIFCIKHINWLMFQMLKYSAFWNALLPYANCNYRLRWTYSNHHTCVFLLITPKISSWH